MVNQKKVTRIGFEKMLPCLVALIFFSVTLRSLQQEQNSYLFLSAFILLLISIFATLLSLTRSHIHIENENLFILTQLFWKPYKIPLSDIIRIQQIGKKGRSYGFIFYLKNGNEFKYIPKIQSNELLNKIDSFLEENVKIGKL